MTDKPCLTVNVDVTNPGQFFACCGLFELAHRLWPEVEGAFKDSGAVFSIYCSGAPSASLQGLIAAANECEISGLTVDEQRERAFLEAEKRQLKKEGKLLPPEKEKRRKELGTMARAGAVSFGPPFNLDLNWWQTSDDDVNTPKTWAGQQEIHKVARAAQDTLKEVSDLNRLFNYGCVLRTPKEYCKDVNDQKKSIEPFYFDARRFAHALNVGFSLDVLGMETVAHPAVELFALVGLQRFRPRASSGKWKFEYSTWFEPLSAPVAAAVMSGAVSIHQQESYQFRLLFRDGQGRLKAFTHSNLIGGKTNE